MLVVQVAKEIDELRYVLSPERMTDVQFWQIYFRLADKYLPEEATDPHFKPEPSAVPGLTFTDIQVYFHNHRIPEASSGIGPGQMPVL